MSGCVRTKEGVAFTVIAPAGFRILSAIDQTALTLDLDLMITSACDGEHSGPDDPHHSGNAIDIRLHDFSLQQQQDIVRLIMEDLAITPSDIPTRVGGGWATMCFFGQIEGAGTNNLHAHIQLRKGCTWPV